MRGSGGHRFRAVDWVAIILAAALGTVTVLMLIVVLINVITKRTPNPTLGENTTQVLTATIGGIIGILGGYVGHAVTVRRDGRPPDDG